MQGQETLAGSGIVKVRAGGTAGLKAGSPIAGSARGTVCSATSGRDLAIQLPSRPEVTVVYTDTDWAVDELTRKSGSCTVEKCGSHMFDCSVAKQSLVALFFRRGRVLWHCQGRGDVKANFAGLGTDRSASGGDHCTRQQCSTRNLHENGIGTDPAPFDQRVVDTGSVSQEGVPVGVGGHVAKLG